MVTKSPPRRRKPKAERRSEILEAASAIAVKEGLESVTMRRVAVELGVFPGLINHYFAQMDGLIIEAFAHAVEGERISIFQSLSAIEAPLSQMREMLKLLLSDASDDVSLVWLDALQAVRKHPKLLEEVHRQTIAWQINIRELIERGVTSNTFKVKNPQTAAMRILALIDGLSIQAAVRVGVNYEIVREMVIENTERELGLAKGRLKRTGTTAAMLTALKQSKD